uniref:FAR1 domain-containing protein n=1 Tax=Amphimedon queenslandica TaxID=400682 RepID=A0A1X7SXG7_AMPQE
MAAATDFKLGEKFSSFDDFESKLEQNKPSEKFVEMWTRDLFKDIQKDCQYHISLKVAQFGSSLEVTSICTEHNHDVSKTLFQHFPRQRRLSPVSVKKQPKAKAWFCRKCHLSAAKACNNS